MIDYSNGKRDNGLAASRTMEKVIDDAREMMGECEWY